MSVTLLMMPMPTVVAACFYSELVVYGAPRFRSGALALIEMRKRHGAADETRAEEVKMRDDLQAVPDSVFVTCWEFMISRMDQSGLASLRRVLDGIFAEQVRLGFEERERRGQA